MINLSNLLVAVTVVVKVEVVFFHMDSACKAVSHVEVSSYLIGPPNSPRMTQRLMDTVEPSLA